MASKPLKGRNRLRIMIILQTKLTKIREWPALNSVYFQVHWNYLSQGVLYRKNALYRMISRLTGNRLNLFSEFYKCSWMLGVFKKCIVFVPNTCCFSWCCNALVIRWLLNLSRNVRWNYVEKHCNLHQMTSRFASDWRVIWLKKQCGLSQVTVHCAWSFKSGSLRLRYYVHFLLFFFLFVDV